MKKYPLVADLVTDSSVHLVGNPAPYAVPKDAEALYKRFHRYAPKKIGEFASGFAIPSRVRLAGAGRWVTYESGKVDPATLKKPRKPLSYIHEHDSGVKVYLTDGKADTDVPKEFRDAPALVLLGKSLGFSLTVDGEDVEAESREPMPELYATPGEGRCLLVVQSKKTVLAMIWGGTLRVEGRGIVG